MQRKKSHHVVAETISPVIASLALEGMLRNVVKVKPTLARK